MWWTLGVHSWKRKSVISICLSICCVIRQDWVDLFNFRKMSIISMRQCEALFNRLLPVRRKCRGEIAIFGLRHAMTVRNTLHMYLTGYKSLDLCRCPTLLPKAEQKATMIQPQNEKRHKQESSLQCLTYR